MSCWNLPAVLQRRRPAPFAHGAMKLRGDNAMQKQQDQTILIDSPEAAHYQTGIKGWVSRQGHYFGDSEHNARYAGCTHILCGQCGRPTEKGRTACNGCREANELARYEAMPRAEWDGKAMLYSQVSGKFYETPDDAAEDLDDADDDLSSLRLVICKPVYVPQLEPDYCADDMANDQEVPATVIDAMEAFNEAVAGIILSWEPGKAALEAK